MALIIRFLAQAGLRPRPAPPVRVTRSRIFQPGWAQGTQGTALASRLRQPVTPRLAAHVSSRRSRIRQVPVTVPVPGAVQLWYRQAPRAKGLRRPGHFFAPPWAQGTLGISAMAPARSSMRPGAGTVLARRERIIVPLLGYQAGSAGLSAAGTLSATALGTVPGSPAVLSETGTLSAWASGGPDLNVLWDAYLTARQAAHQAHANWKMVKGAYDEAIFWYQRYYEADQAEIAAYGAWLRARNATLGIVIPPGIPGTGPG